MIVTTALSANIAWWFVGLIFGNKALRVISILLITPSIAALLSHLGMIK